MKPRIGIFGLSGCWGEQIVILNCEDELFDLVGAVEIVDFLGGSSASDEPGPLDIAFVEGSVGSGRDERKLREIRARSARLVACGSCACFGGVAAALDGEERHRALREVYGSLAEHYDSPPHQPLSAVVPVDHGIPGCPMDKHEFLRAVASLLTGNPPQAPDYPVCMECKIAENDCLLLAHGIPCAGPVTAAGCDALCPRHGAPCIGCRGPAVDCNTASLERALVERGFDVERIRRMLHVFAAPVMASAGREGRS